jgi:tetratricopeptide (TPR) repeat protein
LVLAIGLAGGALAAWLLARKTPKPGGARDRELRRADLETRRDELFARLRGGDGLPLSAPDRAQLELVAARVLRELDSLDQERSARSAPTREREAAPAASPGRGLAARHPLVAGAALGGGMVALVALLIFWAQSDARPAPVEPASGPMSAAAGDGGFDRGEPQLPPEVAEQVAAMQAEIARTGDLDVQRDLAQILLAHGQFFEAFQLARTLLEAAPQDPTGHYVSAVVRYTMGQPAEALQHLDTALLAEPEFVQAALVRGIILLQADDREQAIASWQRGLEAAGGQEPRLEHLLRLAREGRSPEEILATPPPPG